MRKIFILIIFLSAQIFAQNSKTTLSATDKIFVNDYDQNYTYLVSMENIANYLFGGTYGFGVKLTIPNSLSADVVNGIGFNGGLFAWSDGNGDSLFYGASRAWVIALLEAEGVAGDLSAYMTKAGTETVSGQKTYTNLNNYINGTVYFPVKNSYSALAGNQQGFINSTNGKVMFQTKDGSNNKYDLTMASEAWVTANFSAVTGFVKATGTQTGVSSTVTASSGTWTLFTLDAQRLLLREDPATKVSHMLYYDLDQGESGLHIYGDLYIPDDAEVQNMIDDQFSYNQPPELTVAADTLTFRDNNYIAAIYKDNDGTDLYISNSYYGAVSFSVEGTQGGFNIYAKNGISASTWGTIKWANESVPTFSDSSKDYEVLLKRKNSTTIYGYWNYLK